MKKSISKLQKEIQPLRHEAMLIRQAMGLLPEECMRSPRDTKPKAIEITRTTLATRLSHLEALILHKTCEYVTERMKNGKFKAIPGQEGKVPDFSK
jgi:hypothetical protein